MNQKEQPVHVTGAFADTFKLHSLRGNEELGRLFEYTAELLAVDESVAFADVLGANLSVRLATQDAERYFNGFVTRFAQVGQHGRYALYEARMRPWLWHLTRSQDCRIFQNKSVPEILDEIFREYGYTDFETALSENHEQEKREYCVQYRESDFDFVSRLMEEEGIYYFFRHEEDKHTLVLADGPSSHEAIPDCEEVPYLPPGAEQARRHDHISNWWLAQEIQSESYAHRDFDFEHPGKTPEAIEPRPRDHQAGSYEVFDYPGGFRDSDADSRGKRLAGVRIEERVAEFERVRGRGNPRGLMTGGLFNLTGYYREDQNREYLVTGMTFKATAADPETADETEEATYQCTFTAIDGTVCFRTARTTPRPVVRGPQTATVVGPSGEPIHTDEYGRVKCQFHWDRVGGRDENSSCWVRVSQNSAGSGWGSMFVPHVGHEVIVAFLEGDPDRPIVVGRVYNGDNMPPKDLPGNQTKSVVRDHGGNEIVMEGEEGSQRITMHSPHGNTTFNLGAPNSPGEGAFLQSEFDYAAEIGRNLLHTIDGDVKIENKGAYNWIVGGPKSELFGGAVQTKFDGVNATIHGGAVSDTFLGAKHSAHVGAEVKTNASYVLEASYSGGRSYKNMSSRTVLDSTNETKVIGGGGKADISSLRLKGDLAKLKSGEESFVLIHKDGMIVINSENDEVRISAKKIKLIADGKIELDCKDFDYSKAKKVNGLDQSNT